MFYLHERINPGLIESEYPACRYWRRYLLREIDNVGEYTPHGFIMFDKTAGYHKILSCQVVNKKSLLVTQAGPLLVVARRSYKYKDKIDARLWRRSKLMREGGSIDVLNVWDVGVNISLSLYQTISYHFREIVGNVQQYAKRKALKRPKR